MAKRTNIIRIINNEIEKGNNLVKKDGSFVSGEMLKFGIKEDFIKALRAGDITPDVSFEQYEREALSGMVTASDLLNVIMNCLTPADAETEQPDIIPDSSEKGSE